ncbi:MAG: hypothetical protein ACJAR2_003605 [Ilumatobacter sp.]|jgi:hypothetical protein
MNTNKNSGSNSGGTSWRFSRRTLGVATAVTLIASGALGVETFADDEAGGGGPPPSPGEQPSGQPADVESKDGDLVLGSDALIQTSGSNFDETILTKFIPAHGFQVLQGDAANVDTIAPEGGVCVSAAAGSGGNGTLLNAPVELPDGARIKRISFYGHDADATAGVDIEIALYREQFFTQLAFFPLLPSTSRTTTEVDAFSTSGSQTEASVVFGTDDLEEFVGSPSSPEGVFVLGSTNRFHSVRVVLDNTAGGDHTLCGVRVAYQVPVSSADPGTVFHPIDSIRVFDSRQASFAGSGRLGPNETKAIDVTDGYDSAGVAIPSQANLVPTNATAITYNMTVAGATGPNFVAVTAGDAASFTASAINYTVGGSIANGSTVTVDDDKMIKLWGGSNSGSAHVIIDVTGYYAPAPPPSNMGN